MSCAALAGSVFCFNLAMVVVSRRLMRPAVSVSTAGGHSVCISSRGVNIDADITVIDVDVDVDVEMES